jgi:hypothetical protein
VRSFAPVAGVRPRVSTLFEPPTFDPIINSTYEPDTQAQRDQFSVAPLAIQNHERPLVPSPDVPLRTGHPTPKPAEPGRPGMPVNSAAAANHWPDLAKDKTPIQPADIISPGSYSPHHTRIASPIMLEGPRETSTAQPLTPSAMNNAEVRTMSPIRPRVQPHEKESGERTRVQPVSAQSTAARPVTPTFKIPVVKHSSSADTRTPTINVTINSVEVRAAVTPPSPRAKARPAAVLSLDDYLRTRAQESRR